MTAKAIRRKRAKTPTDKFLREIAAQLAELNELTRAGEDLEKSLRARVSDLSGVERETGLHLKAVR